MSEQKPQGGMRFNGGKMRFNLIPIDAKVELARVYTIGAIKYDDNNWLKGMDWSTMIDCADRHFTLWQAGLMRDPDTGCHHLAMAAWNLLGLLVYELRGLGNDNRTKLPMDESFNWTDGVGAELGLSKEEVETLRVKYEKMRAEHKAKLAAVATELKGVATQLEKKAPRGLEVVMKGRLTREGGQDTEGHLYDMFEEQGQGEAGLQNIKKGDILTVWNAAGNIIFQAAMKADIRSRTYWPEKLLNPDWFDQGYTAQLNRPTKVFDPWHIERSVRAESGKAMYYMTKEERKEALQKYTERALAFAAENGNQVDMIAAAKTLESFQEKGVA